MSVCPVDYRYFGDTVTVYRKTPTGITRRVAENGYLLQKRVATALGTDSTFLLILPWDGVGVAPGDKIFRGIGPVNPVWCDLIPELMPQVSVVKKTAIRYWQGSPCHVEATD